MSDCLQNIERISAYVDGELSREDAQLLAEHLADCPSCQALLKAYGGVFPDKKPLPVPDSLAKNVMAGVREISTAKQKAARRRRLFPRVFAAAACLAVMLIAIPRMPNLGCSSADTTGAAFSAMDEARDSAMDTNGAAAEDQAAQSAASSEQTGAAAPADGGGAANDISSGSSAENQGTEGDVEEHLSDVEQYQTVLYISGDKPEILNGYDPVDTADDTLYFIVSAEDGGILEEICDVSVQNPNAYLDLILVVYTP